MARVPSCGQCLRAGRYRYAIRTGKGARMGTPLDKPKACAHCGSSQILLRKQRIASGVFQYGWYCITCDRWAINPTKWIPHAILKLALEKQGKSIDDIPCLNDYSSQCPCIVCGHPGEVHHWAPQALKERFGANWTDWPTNCLCREHHHLWHTVVTPYLVKHRKGKLDER